MGRVLLDTRRFGLNLINKLSTSSTSLSSSTDHDDRYFLIKKNDMEDFMRRCMLKAGSKPSHADSLASCLIAADYRGHFSHGLNRLG
jgi:hypothetical protein